MKYACSRALATAVLALLGTTDVLAADVTALQQQVMERERAFAATMAQRDLAAFATFIAEDAIFFNGPNALRGKAAVVRAWSRLYEGVEAPFSWDPDQVEVLDSGDLALSTGLVRNPAGQCAGRFNSIWRLVGGQWFVVFDKGSDECPAPPVEEQGGTP